MSELAAAWVAPARTALLVVDMQADFAAPDGAMARMGVDLGDAAKALAAAERLVEGARGARSLVVFVGMSTMSDEDSPAWREWTRRRGGDPAADLEVCRAGSAGIAFVGPQPRPEEPVIAKLRYSGFHGTELDTLLRGRGVDTLVVCGLTTDCCVDCTVRDAFHLDYHVFLAGDACAAYSASLHAGALESLAANCAIIVDTAQVLAAWATADL